MSDESGGNGNTVETFELDTDLIFGYAVGFRSIHSFNIKSVLLQLGT